MSLATGSRLGAYEITGVLGAGGMGEVYRARDTVLNREVAIKVLPDALAQDHERVARFRREAELLAALNDPHIAQVYGVELTNGLPAIVMELVDGHTLEQVLTRGRLPWQEALVIARQIAMALDAAHERGIVHRDLKMMSVPISATGSGIVANTPQRLFDASAYPPIGLGRHFDVGPGDRFVMLKRMESSPPVARVVLNFHHEVARQVTAK